MPAVGYALSSEEHGPLDLVRHAATAERAGFSYAFVSDHFHPWMERQGQSPFVWSVIGGIAEATERLRLGTGVTCATIRIHPAIVAQAAATSAAMLPGRFFLGVHGREPERARARRPLARGGRAARNAGRGDRGDPPALGGRVPEPPRTLLHGRGGADLHASRRAAADLRRRLSAAGRRARR